MPTKKPDNREVDFSSAPMHIDLSEDYPGVHPEYKNNPHHAGDVPCVFASERQERISRLIRNDPKKSNKK